jgi:hypothetical protein
MSPPFQRTGKITGAVTVFLALVALGWWLGGLGANSGNPIAAASPEIRATPRERTSLPRRGPPAAAQAAVQTIRDEASPTERLRAAIELANSLPVAELTDWFNGHWFDVREGPELMVFMTLLTARWQHEDPAACAAWALTHHPDLARTTLNAWATRDPQAVLGFFQAHPDDRLEQRTMVAMAAVNPTLVLARLQEMLARGVAREIGTPTSTEYLLRELAMKAPALLTAALDSLPPAARSQAESALVGQRLATDFAGELSRLLARPDGLRLFRDNYRLVEGAADQLLARLGDLPPEWREFIASVPDPSTKEDRQAAAMALATPVFPSLKAKISTPDTWLADVTATDPTKPPSYSLKSGLTNMSREQLAELKGRLQTLPDEQQLQVARMIGGISSSAVEPTLKGEAIRLLAAQPGDVKAAQANLDMAAEHANQWAKSDPAAAGEWARSLPPGDPKLWAMRNLAATWTRYDPAAAKQWVAALPAGDREAVTAFLSAAR